MTSNTRLLKAALGATPDCVPIERFGAPLDARDQAHVEACTRCQSEYALWREFETAPPVEGEGAAVQWIVAELGRRAPGSQVPPIRRAWTAVLRPWAAAVAALVLVVTIGYMAWDREPAVRPDGAQETAYRSDQIRVTAPIGDVRVSPTVLEWVAIPAAVSYDIEVTEVDRTSLLQATSPVSRFELPSSLVQQLVPGKTVVWYVRARNAANAIIADSGAQRVRVLVPGGDTKD